MPETLQPLAFPPFERQTATMLKPTQIRPVARTSWFAVTFAALFLQATSAFTQEQFDDSVRDVLAIIRQNCAECHAGSEAEGGLSFNSRGLLVESETVTVGDSEASLLIELVRSDDPNRQMPPSDRDRLSSAQIDALSAWIDQGLNWTDEFQFVESRYQPPLRPRRPELPTDTTYDHPIDAIVAEYLGEDIETTLLPLTESAFMRRASFDVIGLPAQASTIDATTFERSSFVDELLAQDRAYAEHWMTFWNDLLRNGYSGTGYIDDGRRQITQWLYQSLYENKPYDQFVRELINPPDESSLGFIRGIKWRGNVNASQTREVQFSQNISQVFLGINMKCASCHDSFIDDWTLESAYGLAAIYSETPLELVRCDTPTGRTAEPSWIFPELGNITSDANREQRLLELANLMTHPDNGRLSRTIVNRLWHRLMGRGIVHPIDSMNNAPWNEDLLDYLAVYLVDHDYDLKAVIRLIMTSRVYQSRTVIDESNDPLSDYRFGGPVAKRLTVEQFLDTLWTLSGDWPSPDPKAFNPDGRRQGGQLTAVLLAEGNSGEWGDRPIRAVFTPLDQFQATLGRPNREQVVSSRPDMLTTLEALDLVNGTPLAGWLSSSASKLVDEFRNRPNDLIDHAFRVTLSRQPSTEERTIALELLQHVEQAEHVEDFLWTLILLPEFHYL